MKSQPQERTKSIGRVAVRTSDERLNKGIAWAKEQALSYVNDGDPVGKWYEAALPARESFCVRDVSHQSAGAYMLGLKDYTKNMLHKFAQHIAGERDWCTYWEMNKEDRPTPVDYTDDSDFWYNLPANFDFLHCCYREYMRTGDEDYLHHAVFTRFYDKSLTDYIEVWDKDGDGTPEHYAYYGRRGIASYVEDGLHPLVAGDLLAAQYAAFRAYAEMKRWCGQQEEAEKWLRKADDLQGQYETEWWDEKAGRFSGCKLQDRSFHNDYYKSANYLPLYFGFIGDSLKLKLALEDAIRYDGYNVEEQSHLPDICCKYGYRNQAMEQLLELTDERLHRREYPEVSFAVMGAVYAGLLGIEPDARERTVATLPGLPDELGFIQADAVPLFDGEIDVRHEGCEASAMTNRCKHPIQWTAKFPGEYERLYVNGNPMPPAYERDWNGDVHSKITVVLKEGDTVQVKCHL
ncbi:hypothetical protein M6D81_21255 [Paenibacillus sp. J5C_2022]|uniref:trehalase family glycosidase n=1 Tax=Paenibacillus sp. J5C2022 TaxID=2977129 RepID=UPI0021D3501A|nr:hypothetical protein [Paenibacillus sp. J5C2022]MCU6711224.1 hypothetical protein [Paenibacillus sp. J5C2022]